MRGRIGKISCLGNPFLSLCKKSPVARSGHVPIEGIDGASDGGCGLPLFVALRNGRRRGSGRDNLIVVQQIVLRIDGHFPKFGQFLALWSGPEHLRQIS